MNRKPERAEGSSAPPPAQPFPQPETDRPALVAMIHLAALPGTPHSALLPRQIADQAVAEARIYRDAGVDVLLIENMHDRPYLNRKVGPEITAAMTLAAQAVRGAVPELPLGIQVLAGANREALAIAHACDLQFIRAEALVFGHLADEGWMDADAGELLRYRRAVGAGGVAIWTDVRKKHPAHAASADLTLSDWAREAEFAGADALIVTGNSTGMPARPEDLAELPGASSLPIVVGSGITEYNASLYRAANAWIVGSSLKHEGRWQAGPDRQRVEAMVRAVRKG